MLNNTFIAIPLIVMKEKTFLTHNGVQRFSEISYKLSEQVILANSYARRLKSPERVQWRNHRVFLGETNAVVVDVICHP